MAIRDRGDRVCILDLDEAASFDATGEMPPCGGHRHISRTKADSLTSSVVYIAEGQKHYEASYVGKGRKAILFHDIRQWRKGTSGGYAVMQLVTVAQVHCERSARF